MIVRPYSTPELAARLGISPDRLRRTLAARIAAGMPAPLSTVGQPRFDRASIDAWLTRHHPARPPSVAVPANDPAPLPDTGTDARLSAAYGRERSDVPFFHSRGPHP